jgi:beta-aspartyl-peptidase (threonine type)
VFVCSGSERARILNIEFTLSLSPFRATSSLLMKRIIVFLLLTFFIIPVASSADKAPIAFVIHGGAGRIEPSTFTEERERQYRQTLERALDAGYGILKKGGKGLDAVEAAIVIMEDSPLFNAGKGAVFTSEGKNEMDASIMDGRGVDAGAVGGVTIVKNPIKAARGVMEKTPHVMLMGQGADTFAREAGLEIVDRKYFHTDYRWEAWQKVRNKGFAPEVKPKPKAERIVGGQRLAAVDGDAGVADYLGTVGAVALDKRGDIAAGTSTGGLTNKRYGRIGDSPIIAAGTYANNRTCGISCTGHGEFFIRHVVAYDISARMEHGGKSLQTAAKEVVQQKLKSVGGNGGVIGLDGKGNVIAEFNTAGMFRAWIDASGRKTIAIFKQP